MRNSIKNFGDASLFMGMHSTDETTRIACKLFFVERFHDSIAMSYEQVGRCDDVVWGYEREVQDAYYPFMDNLHTDMEIRRFAYDEADLRLAQDSSLLRELAAADRLLLAMVMNRGGVLYSVNRRLLGRTWLPVRAPPAGPERMFPAALEELYRRSLQLRVTTHNI